jgi:hypothetical protein
MVLTHSYLRTDARFFRSHGAYIHTTLEKGSKRRSLLAGTSTFLTPARSGSHRGRDPAHDLQFHHPPTSSYLKGEESHCHGTRVLIWLGNPVPKVCTQAAMPSLAQHASGGKQADGW